MTTPVRTDPRTAAGPSLRGLGWGLLALVVAAVVLFAAVLGASGPTRNGAAAPSPGSTAAPVPPVGPDGPPLRGAWAFDEGSGRTAADGGGAGNPVSLRDAARWVPDGRSGAAVSFDGTGSYAATDGPVLDTSQSYTVSAWVRLDSMPTGFATAVSQDGGVDSAFFLQYVPSSNRWSMSGLNPGGVGVRALSTVAPEVGRWTLLTGVRDIPNGRLILYVDGARQSSTLYAQRPMSSGPLAIGRGLFGNRQVDFFPGAVDGLRVYGGALTPEEVRTVYDSGR